MTCPELARNPSPRPLGRIAALAMVGLLGAGCDFSVTNPGALDDDALNTRQAMAGLVNGMSGDLSFALGNYLNRVAVASGELVHAGNFVTEAAYFRGDFGPDEVNADWARMQRARWVAEDGIRRMQSVLGSDFESHPDAARAYLYAGFANRLMGENACVAVIDAGPALDSNVHFERADSLFTRAISIAQAQGRANLVSAGRGGRATVRAWLGDWAGAESDAVQVAPSFVFNAIFSTNTSRENNELSVQTISRRETTVWNTTHAQGPIDLRTPWDTVFAGSGAILRGQDGNTPFFRQTKYTSLGDDVALVRGTEMLLLRAEAALRGSGGVEAAVQLMNQGRAEAGMGAASAAGPAEAWALLQAERGSVLWLEGRRLWDLRRWHAESPPVFNDFLDGRNKCIPPGADEAAANPNLQG
jgi:starch-binding outer membrane protein, SusD/RagB family